MKLRWKVKELLCGSNYAVFTTAILSAVIFGLIYGVRVLNPAYTDWLLISGGDRTQHYLGWKAFSRCGWKFPIGNMDCLAYPTETSVIFTDSLPLLAIPCKIITSVFRVDFQFFGLWELLCFILQGMMAARIIGHYVKDGRRVILASLFFVISPVMLQRSFESLEAHWLVLLAMETLFAYGKYRESRKIYVLWAAIGALAVAIHTYFIMICGTILVGYCLADMLSYRRIGRSFLTAGSYLGGGGAAVLILGGLSGGFKKTSDGLGRYSLNLNAFFNPQGYSRILPDLGLYGDGQYEGLAYLGAGCILLLIAAVAGVITASGLREKIWGNRVLFFALAATFLIAFGFALSPTITFGDRVIAELPLPDILYRCWSVFRSTGRCAWVCVYMLMLCAVIAVCRLDRGKTAPVLLLICLLLQTYDLYDVMQGKRAMFNRAWEYEDSIGDEDAAFWDAAGSDDGIEVVILAGSVPHEELFAITDWALDHGKAMNRFYFARNMDEVIAANLEEALAEPKDSYLYIFPDEDAALAQGEKLHYYQAGGYVAGCTRELPYGKPYGR